MVEGARLESVYTATYRGFESLSLRHHLSLRNILVIIIKTFEEQYLLQNIVVQKSFVPLSVLIRQL